MFYMFYVRARLVEYPFRVVRHSNRICMPYEWSVVCQVNVLHIVFFAAPTSNIYIYSHQRSTQHTKECIYTHIIIIIIIQWSPPTCPGTARAPADGTSQYRGARTRYRIIPQLLRQSTCIYMLYSTSHIPHHIAYGTQAKLLSVICWNAIAYYRALCLYMPRFALATIRNHIV